MKQPKIRLLSTLLCVSVLAALFTVSGCVFEEESQKHTPPVESEWADTEEYKNFNELIAVKNKYDNEVVTYYRQYTESLSALKAGTELTDYDGPPYEELKKGLAEVKRKGVTPKRVETEVDAVLTVLNELVPVQIELKKQRSIQGGETVQKYLQLVEQFNVAFGALDTDVRAVNKEKINKKAEQMRSRGYSNYATAIEVMSRFTDLTETVIQTRQNPDRAQIEKDAAAIMTQVNSINSDKPEVVTFKEEAQKLVTAIQVAIDFKDTPHAALHLQRMYQQFNFFIAAFNQLPPKGIDGK